MDTQQKIILLSIFIALLSFLLFASNTNAASATSKSSTSVNSTTTICSQNAPCLKLKNGTTTTIPNKGIYTGVGGFIYKIITAILNFFKKY